LPRGLLMLQAIPPSCRLCLAFIPYNDCSISKLLIYLPWRFSFPPLFWLLKRLLSISSVDSSTKRPSSILHPPPPDPLGVLLPVRDIALSRVFLVLLGRLFPMLFLRLIGMKGVMPRSPSPLPCISPPREYDRGSF